MKKMKNVQVAFLVAAIYETFFAIPVLGWFVYVGSWGNFILVSLVIHILTLILANQEKRSITGSMAGILATAFAIIPFIGWALHVIASILNYLQVLEVSLVNSNFKNGSQIKNDSKCEKEKRDEKVKDAEIEENK